MKKILTTRKNLLFSLAGMLLILVGVAGILGPLLKDIAEVKNYSYRLINLQVNAAVIQEVILEENMTVDIEPIETDIDEKPVMIYTGSKYIHSTIGMNLEEPNIPTKIVVSSINLEALVVSADFHQQQIGSDYFGLWEAPDWFAAGWHPDSALLGETGNTVINGHHNTAGLVFQNLVNLQVGEIVTVYANQKEFNYVVTNRMILPELYVDVETRLNNARWLAKSDDERLTLVTCWPADSNTHRLIVVAKPEPID